MYLYPFYIPVIALSFLTSLLIYLFRNTGYLKYFPPFLLITFIVEFSATKMAYRGIHNGLLYNIYTTLEIPFFLFFIRSLIQNMQVRTIIVYSAILYCIIRLVDLIMLTANSFHFVAYNLGALMIIAFCCWYFLENSGIRAQPSRLYSGAYLVCLGLILFFTSSLPIYITLAVVRQPSRPLLITCVIILNSLNVLMYFLFSLAFILRFKVRNQLA